MTRATLAIPLVLALLFIAAGGGQSPGLDAGPARAHPERGLEITQEAGAKAAPEPRNAEHAVEQPPPGPDGRPASVPEPPVSLGSGGWVREKIGETISFTGDVDCGVPWGVIGTVSFEYYLWKGNSAGNVDPNDMGGAVLWGGFDKTGDCNEPSGWSWAWVQVVSATDPGQNDWNAAPDQWFVDGTSRTDPRYPYTVAGYEAGFQDWPWRWLAQPADAWRAELALVCINMEQKHMKVVASLYWGYTISATGEVAEGAVFGSPSMWWDATQNFIDTVKHDWPNEDGPDFKDWTVEHGCCCQGPTAVEETSWGVIKALYR